jgi:hypothetical protein
MPEDSEDHPEPQDGEDTPTQDVNELPQWARDQITRANKEAARYRTKARELEPLAQKAKDLEAAGQSETEKLTGKLTEAEQRAATAEARAMRLEVAHDKGLTSAQANRLVGTTKEELEADADELLAQFSPKETQDDDDERRRPRERLRSGAAPDAEDEPDIDAAVAATRRF